jgi:hypothetical protein
MVNEIMRCLGNIEAHMPRSQLKQRRSRLLFPAAGNRLAPRRYNPAVKHGLKHPEHDVVHVVQRISPYPRQEQIML